MNKRIRKKKVREMMLIELAILFPDENDAIVWLETPLDALEGRTPHDAVDAGEWERVTLILDGLNSAKHAAKA